MSENPAPQVGATAGAATPPDGVAAGQRLRQAREAAGLHVVALAAALKVPVKKLEALEAGRMGELPDATFARALAASVCRQLKLDPAEVLALLPQAGGSRLGEDQTLNTPFRSPRDPAGASRAQQGVPKAVWVALLILLAAAVVWWAVPPTVQESALAVPAEPLQPAAPSEGATSMGAGAHVSEETAAPPSDASAAPATPASAGSGAPAPDAVTTPSVTAAPATVQAGAASTPSAQVPAGAEVLLIRARTDSWIEVSSQGKVLLQRVVKAGESVSLSDAPPLAVVVGRADATEVLVRGKAFDLMAVARNNVARFEVK